MRDTIVILHYLRKKRKRILKDKSLEYGMNFFFFFFRFFSFVFLFFHKTLDKTQFFLF